MSRDHLHWKALGAEWVGTFLLVLVGTGSIIVNRATGEALGQLGISLAFGGIVTLMILALGATSGAHLNPAVTLIAWQMGHLNGRTALSYALVQGLAALAASLILSVLFHGDPDLGASLPGTTIPVVFALEVALTFALAGAILWVSEWMRWPRSVCAITIGSVVFLEAYFGGPWTGASMNPARSLGPAVISGQTAALWLYLIATPIGAQLALWSCRRMQRPGCCRAEEKGTPHAA